MFQGSAARRCVQDVPDILYALNTDHSILDLGFASAHSPLDNNGVLSKSGFAAAQA